ncbi:FIMAH domain-containing protein [Paenibacillus senegalensis]|uniref:FIMAH domain-containing protein n=1 Tax=Paenibacillus senegalensis TaxID=1465766 RepID=UPI0005A83E57|nr:pectinesterase [Paenibacillus senegalensis]
MSKLLTLMLSIVLSVSILPMSISAAEAEPAVLPAFPGAEGFGYAATGGRGGEVYHVNSYELTGPGTFHDALTTTGDIPRTIVFDISGEITIPQIVVRGKSNITIAGQTAPGDGVTIKGNNVRFIDCEDIIIRYLRFRMGDQSFNDDSMYFEDSRNVIIDHSSFSWGTDEVLSILSKDYNNPRSKNITVQWSIMSEGLLTHSMGGLIEMNTITMHHNLYAHNNDRNPKTKGQIDFVNNIIYNWGQYPYVAGGESGTKGYGNVVGNYFIAGQNSANPHYAVVRGNENYSLYLHNNRIDSNKNGILDGTDTGPGMMEQERPSVLVPERFNYPLVHTQDPETAYEYVLDYSGASLVRDAVDKRIVSNVRNQTGAIIGHEDDVGGFPELRRETAPVDTDRDGMPDEWELVNGLDPNDPEDRNGDFNGDGYTNLEKYLNELAAPGFPQDYPMEPPAWPGPPFTPPIEPEPERPAPEPKPSMDGNDIRNVVINDNSSNGAQNAALWTVEDNLRPGDLVAGDRLTGSKVYRFVTIPEDLQGMEWIRSAVASRSATNSNLLSFYLAADAEVYVAHDSRITAKPEWLTSYEDTGELIADDQPVQFKLYKKSYQAGSHVVMGANNSTSRMNYFVILKPTAPEAVPPDAAPSGLAGDWNEEAGAVSLEWSPVNGAESYLIYRSSSKDNLFRAAASSTVPAYEDTDVEQGVTYTYQVSALNSGGESPQSAPAEVVTFDPAQPAPSAPTGLQVSAARSLSVDLEWTPVEGAVSYSLYRASVTDSTYNGTYDSTYKKIGYSMTAKFTDKSVEPSSSYIYKVTATGAGGESERSAGVSTTTMPPVAFPQVPDGLYAGEVTTSSFEIHWNPVEEAESYNVYRKADGDNAFARISSTASPSFLDETISVGQTGYSYKVTAVNEMGESAQSAELAVAMPLPAAPTELTVGLVGETFVGLIWTSQGGENQVNIYREAGGEVRLVGSAKVNTYYDRTVEPDVEYTYYIKAQNASGESEISNSVKVTPGWLTVLENSMEQYTRSGDLTGPAAAQLSNTLRQAKHHYSKGSIAQAVRFMEKYADQLDRVKPEHLSIEAKFQLSQYAQLLLERWK